MLARGHADAPDIDCLVRVKGKDLQPGDLVSVKITAADGYDLVGRRGRPTALNRVGPLSGAAEAAARRGESWPSRPRRDRRCSTFPTSSRRRASCWAWCCSCSSTLELWIACIAVFAVAAFTDWLDGYIARRQGITSTLGRNLDPLVDKVLICGAYMFLITEPDANIHAVDGDASWWPAS